MVLTHNTKRKRKEVAASTSLLLEESPKRTKVQAQRKFAQGSNVSSPVLTPVEELDAATDRKDALPEPIELVPMKRPNTEDFLTFLCFRGTPALPPSLSFFNNPRNDRASIGSSSNSSSNGSIATIPFSSITQSSQSRRPLPLQPPSSICSIMRPSPPSVGSDPQGGGGRPFVAFGVRKRADPVLVSRHMDRKRRHALALHALRRRYQEQRQAKLRALTVSKLSADKGGGNLGGGGWGQREVKETSRDIKDSSRESSKDVITKNITSSEVPTSSTDTSISAKRKTANIRANLRPIVSKVRTRGNCAPPHTKPPRRIIQRKLSATPSEVPLTSGVKQKMCLRSFRGRFVQRELSVVKVPKKQPQRRIAVASPEKKKEAVKGEDKVRKVQKEEEKLSDEDSDNAPLTSRKLLRKQLPSKKSTVELRLTRSSKLITTSAASTTKRQTFQRRFITANTKNILKTKLRQRVQVSKEALKSPEVLPRKLGLRGTLKREIAKQKTIPRRVVRRIVVNSELIPGKSKKGVVDEEDVKTVDESALIESIEVKGVENSGNKNVEVVKKAGEAGNKPSLVKEKPNVTTRNEASKVAKLIDKVVDKTIKVALKDDAVVTRNSEKLEKDKPTLRADTKMLNVEKVVELLKEKSRESIAEAAKGAVKEKPKPKEILPKKKADVKEKQTSVVSKLTKDKLESCDIVEAKPEEVIVDKALILKGESLEIIEKQDVNSKLNDKDKQLISKGKDKLEPAKVNLRKQPVKLVPEVAVKEKELLKGKVVETPKKKIDVAIEKLNVTLDKKKPVLEKIEDVKETNNGDSLKDPAKEKPKPVKVLPKNIVEEVQINAKETLIKKLPKTTPEVKQIVVPKVSVALSVNKMECKDNKIIQKVVEAHSMISTVVKVEKLAEINKATTLSPKHEVKSEIKSSVDEIIKEVIENDSKLKAKIDYLESKLAQNIAADLLQSKKLLKAEETVTTQKAEEVKPESVVQKISAAEAPVPKKLAAKRDLVDIVLTVDGKKKKVDEEVVEVVKEITIVQPILTTSNNCNEAASPKKVIPKKRLVKEKPTDHNVSQRPTRKTKEAAALYMEILNHKLENDDDNGSIDSFPELPNVKKMFQREHELKTAQATKTKAVEDKNKTKETVNSDSSDDCLIKYKNTTKPSEKSAKSQVNIEKRATRNKSPKLYKSFTDTDESDDMIEIKPKQAAVKRKSDAKKQVKKGSNSAVALDFSESDEEPLANLKSTKEPSSTVTLEIPTEMPSPTYGKPKRECTKRPQNYLTIFSSSDDEERYFHTKKPEVTITPVMKKESAPVDVLTSKDIGRRFGKGKVNMSTEQIEKWLNDSALAGLSVRKENDEMLKFGEKIPTEQAANVVNQNPVTLAESLKSDIVVITGALKDKPPTPLKSSEASNNKPSSAERKTIFRKKLTPEISPQKVNAFSVQNERSVYAFEPEPEVSVSTPFRRPTRRPSSTATSKSEDENKLVINDQDLPSKCQFRHPSENVAKNKMCPPKVTNTKATDKSQSAKAVKPSQKNSAADRLSETSEDWKYKVPSSPSAASSSSSAKLYKKSSESRFATSTILKVSHAEFPSIHAEKAAMVDAPVFYPTEKEFQDPLEYIEKVRSHAERYGICKIVPPANFRPECKIADEMRFTAYNQYVGKMLRRWGPSFKELMAIRRYMRTQRISLKPPPLIGGIEVDLPRLYQTVQTLGGLKEVIEKKKWPKVSELMKIPKSAQDRVTKLDDIYCKYLLPYDTLSPAEREKLFDDVETHWAKRESRSLLKAQKAVMDDSDDPDAEDDSDEDEDEAWEDDEAEECIVKGKNMALNAFFRIARNTLAMWFKNADPSTVEVEDEFWRLVRQRQHHVCVHSGSIDCGGSGGPSGAIGGGGGYGFATGKSAACARHPANLKVLTNSSGSVLRSMGAIMGLTVPTLHVGMVFSACCWYRDPHSLPWVEYLHTGASKVWYAVPGAQSTRFQTAVNTHMPQYCRNKSLWLPVDTAMLPPELLTKSGCSLSRVTQEPGQFVVVFEKAFTSNVCTGYVVSESVFWAPSKWLSQSAQAVFHELRANREPSVFSYERLVLSIATDQRASIQSLREVVEPVQAIHDRERAERGRLVNALGVREDKDKLPLPDMRGRRRRGGRGGGKHGGQHHVGPGGAAPPPPQHWAEEEEGEYECYVCRANLYVSMVADTKESVVFCLSHAIRRIEQSRLHSANCRLLYTYTVPELDALCSRLQALIDLKLQRKQPHKVGNLNLNSGVGKFSGLPTLLNR